jgi:hypothetical protein
MLHPAKSRDCIIFITACQRTSCSLTSRHKLSFCLTHQLYSGTEFEQVLRVQASETKKATQADPITLLRADVADKARQAPQASKLDDYESIINP